MHLVGCTILKLENGVRTVKSAMYGVKSIKSHWYELLLIVVRGMFRSPVLASPGMPRFPVGMSLQAFMQHTNCFSAFSYYYFKFVGPHALDF